MTKPSPRQTLDDFKQSLIAAGKSRLTIKATMNIVHRFLSHVGDARLDRLSEEVTREFFNAYSGQTRQTYANAVSQFLRFAARDLPAVVTARGEISPRAAAPTKKDLALRQKWTLDKLLDQKTTDDDLIAKLGRKVIDGYLICQRQIKGEINLDDLVRHADECRDLIESNLALFMTLSAQGRNVHSAIDERIQR
jgi:hypothetical protein